MLLIGIALCVCVCVYVLFNFGHFLPVSIFKRFNNKNHDQFSFTYIVYRMSLETVTEHMFHCNFIAS